MKPIKQYQLAEKVGVTPGFISLVLTGKKRPSWPKAKKLAQITGTKPELWLEGSPDEIREAIKNANNTKAA